MPAWRPNRKSGWAVLVWASAATWNVSAPDQPGTARVSAQVSRRTRFIRTSMGVACMSRANARRNVSAGGLGGSERAVAAVDARAQLGGQRHLAADQGMAGFEVERALQPLGIGGARLAPASRRLRGSGAASAGRQRVTQHGGAVHERDLPGGGRGLDHQGPAELER